VPIIDEKAVTIIEFFKATVKLSSSVIDLKLLIKFAIDILENISPFLISTEVLNDDCTIRIKGKTAIMQVNIIIP
jgi:hypothetical protein